MKKIFTLLSVIITSLAFASSVNAMSLSPSSGNFPSSQNKVITLKSTYSEPHSAVQIRLTVNNAKVTNYTSPGGSVLPIGTCDANGASFRAVSSTRYEVCVNLASTAGEFSSGSSLGSITLAALNASGGTFSITGDSDNGYLLDDDSLEPATGNLGSYNFTVSNSSTNPQVSTLPNTAISDYLPERGILGIAIFATGIISFAIAIKVFLIDKKRALLE